MMRTARFGLLFLSIASCGTTATTTVSGDAFDFQTGLPSGGISAAHVFVLEDPSLTTTTDAAGHFEITGVPVGSDATLVMEHPDYVLVQTGTNEVPAGGLTRVTFQAVTPSLRDALAIALHVTIDDTRCQLVTTVTRIGRSVYDPGAHGEDGVVVTSDPPIAGAFIYFNSSVFPDPTLTQTSDDGGTLFVNVAPGEYTWTATKAGATFRQVRLNCRAGVLVNAAPPWGLQRLE